MLIGQTLKVFSRLGTNFEGYVTSDSATVSVSGIIGRQGQEFRDARELSLPRLALQSQLATILEPRALPRSVISVRHW